MKPFSPSKPPCRAVVGLSSILLILALAGCGGSGETHDHDHHHHEGHGHAHQAPHGGALTMLGDHRFQLELVPNAEARTLDLYVLDGGAEHFVRVAPSTLKGVAQVGERTWELTFQAVANAATGETVGASAHFSTAAPELVGEPAFVVTFDRIELLGQVFEAVSIPYPDGSH